MSCKKSPGLKPKTYLDRFTPESRGAPTDAHTARVKAGGSHRAPQAEQQGTVYTGIHSCHKKGNASGNPGETLTF